MQKSFWTTRESAGYQQFAISLASDKVAYAITYHLLNPVGKAILDFGCYNGTSTNNIRIAGASSVTGVDQNAIEIARAKITYARFPNLAFHHVGNAQAIPAARPFDGAAMTFVHSTISDAGALECVLRKIAKVTAQGGNFVLLGLHPESFRSGYTFLNYSHRLPIGSAYTDAQPFLNELRLKGGQCLQFYDYCWTEATLITMLQASGFKVLNSIGLKADSLDETVRTLFDAELESIAATEGLTWQSEWTAPLYHIVVAEKM